MTRAACGRLFSYPVLRVIPPALVQKIEARALTEAELYSSVIGNAIDDLHNALHYPEHPGMGLAAPQVGWSWKLFVIEIAHTGPLYRALNELIACEEVPFSAYANASYMPAGDETQTFYEGCLSIPGMRAQVRRWSRVTVRAIKLPEVQPVEFEVEGLTARAFQHEIDHTEGLLYLDKMVPRTLISNSQYQDWLATAEPSEIKALITS